MTDPVDRSAAEVPDGIDVADVTAWLSSRADVSGDLSFSLIQGGRSNLTYTVRDETGTTWVLRRPPLHSVLKSAHDVAREHRLMSALQSSDVPVPPVVGLSSDAAVNGAPFYVMDFVEGHVVRNKDDAERLLDEDGRAGVGRSLVDTLATLHAVDPDAVGLGDLAKKEDYVARQLRRWHGQFEKGRTRNLPVIDDVHARLAAAIPPQGRAAIVHGDYRVDNVIVDDDGQVRAVLDWELCTLGDRRADLGLLSVYWADEGDESIPLLDAPTTVAGFPSRDEVMARYREASGDPVEDLDYFVAFGLWKLAIILEGVYARYASGAYGEDHDGSHKAFADVVVRLAERASDAATAAGR